MSKQGSAKGRSERAAEVLAEQQRAQRRQNFLRVAVVAGVLATIVVVAFVLNAGRDNSAEIGAKAAGISESGYGLVIGEEGAPSELIIYEDFVCPFCADFEEASVERLTSLAEDGKVQVEYRPFNLLGTEHTINATIAFSTVLEAGDAEAAKVLHDELFAEQPPEAGPYPDTDFYVDLAEQAGGDGEAVRAALEAQDTEWVEAATQEAQEAGVNGTPTILLNGEVFTDFRTVEEAADNLEMAIEAADTE